MMAEQVPQCLLWLPILHRMTRVENGQYRYVLHRVRMMFGVSSIVLNINTERVKDILWHTGPEINMRSTRSPSTTSCDQGLDKTEHLRVPLLFARDNLGCNDVYTLCLKYRRMYLKAVKNDKDILFAKILPTVIEQKVRCQYTFCVLSSNFLLEKTHGGNL